MSDWISVKDQLPPQETKVLTTWLGKVEMAIINEEVDNWQEWPDGDFDTGGEVTHWMPLPELPEA